MRLWVQCQDPPTSTIGRYRVLGVSRRPTYTLPGGSSSQHQRPDVGPSHSGVGLSDDIIQRVMLEVRQILHTDSSIIQQVMPSSARLHQVAQEILAGANAESTGIPQDQFDRIMGEVIRMMTTLLFRGFQPPSTSPG